MEFYYIIFFFITYLLFFVFNFFYFLFRSKLLTNRTFFTFLEIFAILIFPLFFLLSGDVGKINDCCLDNAVFAPGHSIGIYMLIVGYTLAYILSYPYNNILLPPIAELLLSIFCIIGLVINILLCIHLNKEEFGTFLWLFGNIPIIVLLIMKLIQRQQLIRNNISTNNLSVNNAFGRVALRMLQLNPLIKYPALLFLVLPVTLFLSLILLIFGQKPDSLIRAFTDTYKHGFSQLDYMCDNVSCGGHFLCSVGANGHKQIVKPIRYGERNGKKIICTRQLLISNAFEDLLQERFPSLHVFIRKRYNKVRSFIHKYYRIFNIKWISDFVYILMKPLEWIFLLLLYTFDKRPENRIAIQYLSFRDRESINVFLKK